MHRSFNQATDEVFTENKMKYFFVQNRTKEMELIVLIELIG